MKKAASLVLRLIVLSILLALIPLHANATAANTEITTSVDFEISRLDHIVQIRDGGLVIINDTVSLSTTNDNMKPSNFPIGFPFKYMSHLEYCFAYVASNPDEKLNVTLDIGLEKLGFYGLNVTLPTNVNDESSFNFTVTLVFSNFISTRTTRRLKPEVAPPEWETVVLFDVDFPIYPSLTQDVSSCDVTVLLPPNAYYEEEESSHIFNQTILDSRIILNHVSAPLTKFADESAKLTFEHDSFNIFNIKEVKRDITLDKWGNILISDIYNVINKADWNLTEIRIYLPQGAYDVSYHDERGDHTVDPKELPNPTIYLPIILRKEGSVEFTVTYRLPWKNYVSQPDWRNFDLTMSFFEQRYPGWLIRKLSLTVDFPEGADFQSCSVPPQSVEEGVIFAFHNVTPFHDLDFRLTYEYIIFWASFRPTLWIGLLVAVVCVIAFLWRAPKPAPAPIIPVSPGALRSFVDGYERKTSAIRELEMLEQQVRKRKIPRRRYKVRKKALEDRLSVLSKDLTDLKEEIGKASSRYANIMRQIEVAETELEETETAIRRIELRYRRREISKETYRKLLEEYNHRKERAETTIDGVLLRLREEIR